MGILKEDKIWLYRVLWVKLRSFDFIIWVMGNEII